MFFNKEKKEEIFNPLNLVVGAGLVVDTIDFRDKELKVTKIVEFKREINGETFLFTDYILGEELKLRVMPDNFCIMLNMFYEQEFDEGFLNTVQDACTSTFNIDDENAEFTRNKGLKEPYVAMTKSSSTEEKVAYWDFMRDTKDEAGFDYVDFLFIERNEKTGWFQIWRGEELAKDHVKTL